MTQLCLSTFGCLPEGVFSIGKCHIISSSECLLSSFIKCIACGTCCVLVFHESTFRGRIQEVKFANEQNGKPEQTDGREQETWFSQSGFEFAQQAQKLTFSWQLLFTIYLRPSLTEFILFSVWVSFPLLNSQPIKRLAATSHACQTNKQKQKQVGCLQTFSNLFWPNHPVSYLVLNTTQITAICPLCPQNVDPRDHPLLTVLPQLLVLFHLPTPKDTSC